jgi:hypothetical protein
METRVPEGGRTPEPQPHPDFTDDHRKRVLAIFEERGLFGPRETAPDASSAFAARVDEYPGTKPFAAPHRRLSPDKREALEQLINEMLADGRIQPSHLPYSAPIVMVRKSNGKWRFCVDYRGLNQGTIADAFPLPHINDVFARVQGAKVMSCIDLASGYHNLAMHPDHRHKTAFVSPEGLWEWTVLPLGVTNGPAQFSRFMTHVTHGLLRVMFYLDDLLVASTSVEQHMSDLVALADRLASHNLLVNRDKLQLGLQGAHVLGHTLSRIGCTSPLTSKPGFASSQIRPLVKNCSAYLVSALTSARGYPTLPRSPNHLRQPVPAKAPLNGQTRCAKPSTSL